MPDSPYLKLGWNVLIGERESRARGVSIALLASSFVFWLVALILVLVDQRSGRLDFTWLVFVFGFAPGFLFPLYFLSTQRLRARVQERLNSGLKPTAPPPILIKRQFAAWCTANGFPLDHVIDAAQGRLL